MKEFLATVTMGSSYALEAFTRCCREFGVTIRVIPPEKPKARLRGKCLACANGRYERAWGNRLPRGVVYVTKLRCNGCGDERIIERDADEVPTRRRKNTSTLERKCGRQSSPITESRENEGSDRERM